MIINDFVFILIYIIIIQNNFPQYYHILIACKYNKIIQIFQLKTISL